MDNISFSPTPLLAFVVFVLMMAILSVIKQNLNVVFELQSPDSEIWWIFFCIIDHLYSLIWKLSV